MSRRYFIETLPNGDRQFVSVKRSRSLGHSHSHNHNHNHNHNHRHHHSHRTPPPCNVSREDRYCQRERERALEESNRFLCAENESLRKDLAATQDEVCRLRQTVPRLERKISLLINDNDSLRRSLENAGNCTSKNYLQVEKLQHKVHKLERENKAMGENNTDLVTRVRALSRQLDENLSRRVEDLMKEAKEWKDCHLSLRGRYEELRRHYDRVVDTSDCRKTRLRAYEDMLKRAGILPERQCATAAY